MAVPPYRDTSCQLIPTRSTTKTRVEPPGMGPWVCSPWPSAGAQLVGSTARRSGHACRPRRYACADFVAVKVDASAAAAGAPGRWCGWFGVRPAPTTTARSVTGGAGEATMLTTLDEIADGIYRISTFVPEIGPDGFTINQFLLDADEPLLYHTG